MTPLSNGSKWLLLVFGIFLSQNVFCQENFLTGYIITQHGDTIKGLIDYREWESNPKKINFKKNQESDSIVFTPLDIKLFSVKDELYISAIIETEVSPDELKDMLFKSELQIKIDTTFLQTIVEGAKSLYYYKRKFGNQNFFILEDGKFKLLVRKRYLKEVDGRKLIVENKKFVGQLILYLQDCLSISSKLNSTEYNLVSMKSLFQYYYDCTKTGIKFERKKEEAVSKFGILAGMSSSRLQFKSSGGYWPLDGTNYPNSSNFSGGLFFNFIFPRNLGKFSICNDIVYTSYNVKGDVHGYSAMHYYTIYETEFGYSYLKLMTMFRLRYPIGGSYFYLNAGITNGFALTETNNIKLEDINNPSTILDEGSALPYTRKYEQGYIFGLGISFKKISFEIRLEKANGFSAFDDLGSNVTRYYYLLGYQF